MNSIDKELIWHDTCFFHNGINSHRQKSENSVNILVQLSSTATISHCC